MGPGELALRAEGGSGEPMAAKWAFLEVRFFAVWVAYI